MKFRSLTALTALTIACVVAPQVVALGAGATTSTAGARGAHRAEALLERPRVRKAHDARRDVLSVAQRKGKDVFTPAPARHHGDITSFRVAHREATVVGRIKTRRRTRDDRFFGAVLQLRTAQGTYTAVVFRPRVGRPLEMQFDGGGKQSCAGLRHRIHYSRETVTIAIPRTCLGNPAWVRSRAVIDYFGRPGTGDAFFADAAPGTDLTPVPFLAKVWRPGIGE